MSYSVIVFLCFVVFAAVSYLLGSINFAIITTKAFTGKDVRQAGSGNAGMTNVMRTAGLLPGTITFVGDFCKGIVAVVLGKYALTPLLTAWLPAEAASEAGIFAVSALTPLIGGAIAGCFCLLGHVFPVFFGFRGGKGIATAAGTMLIMDWRLFLIEIGIFLILFLGSRIISLGSVVAAVCYPVIIHICMRLFPPADATNAAALAVRPVATAWILTLFALLTALLVLFKHKDNILRLIKGEEKKLTLKK